MLTPKAVALKYQAYEDNAPKVVAKGSGEIAKTIIEKAKEFDVALFKNAELTDLLMNTELDSEIDPKLYEGVVEVFMWLHKLQNRAEMSKN